MALIDPEISRRKLERELADWERQSASYRKRGYLIVGRHDLCVDVAFFGRLPIGGKPQPLPAVTACARLNFDNYDLWPASVDFIDMFTGELMTTGPHAAALEHRPGGAPTPDGTARNMLVAPHPETKRPFVCHPGIREYHTHPEHSGDFWLLHRNGGEGTLAAIAERLWRWMARNIAGLQLAVVQTPAGNQAMQAALTQWDVDAQREQELAQQQAQQQLRAQMQAAQRAAAPGQVPGGLLLPPGVLRG